MDAIRLQIVTAEGTVLERAVEYVNLPTAFGSVGILSNHAPMLCAVEEGILRCRSGEGILRLRIGRGIASVENNEVNVLVAFGAILED